jgi:PAS domain S-box-containing protein
MQYSRKNEDMQRVNAELQEMVAKRTMELVAANRSLRAEIAERQKTEKALRENERKYRDLVALLPLTVYECDETGRITYANDIGAKVFGYTREEFEQGINIRDLISDQDSEKSTLNMTRIKKGGKLGASDYNLKRKDGGTFPAITFSSPIIRGGKTVGLRGVIMDITERKWSERIVMAQRDLGLALAGTGSLDEALRLCLDSAIEAADVDAGAIYMIDPARGDLNMVCMRGISDGFAQRVRHIPAGTKITKVVMKGKPRYLDTDDPTVFLKDVIQDEGFRAKAVIPIPSQGKVIGALAISSRTSDTMPAKSRAALEAVAGQIGTAIMRAQAEEALRLSETRFRNLANLLPQPVFEFDRSGDVVFLNQMSMEVFGYDKEDLRKGIRNIRMVIPPAETDKFADSYDRVMKGEKLTAAEFTLARKDGSTFPAIAFISPVIRSGEVVGFRGTVIDITERKQAEMTLLESESKFRDLAEKSVAGVYLVQDGIFQYANQKFAEIFGYPVEEISGRLTAEKAIFPGDWPLVRENLRKRFSGEIDSLQYEFRICTKSGEVRHAEVYSSRTTYQGKPAVIGTLLDITDRRRAEEALRTSEAWLRQVIDLVPHFIFAKDQEGRFILVNKAAAEAFGTTVQELTGKTDADFNPNRSEVDHFLKDDLFVMESGQSKEIQEEPITDATGRTRILQTTKIPVAVSPAGGKAVLGVSTDITAYKRAQQALQESEEKYRNIFENATEGIFQTTLEGRFLNVNPSMARMLGYESPEDLMSRVTNLEEQGYGDPEDRKRLLKLLETKSHIEGFETQVVRRDGKRIWISINTHAVFGSGGGITYYEGTVEDITQRKLAEQALQESEAKYRNVVENALVGSFIIQDGKFRFVNQRFVEITGYRYEEIVDVMGPMEIIHPDDQKKTAENIDKRLAGWDDHRAYDIRVVRKDGQTVDLKVLGSPLTYNGRMAIAGTFIDITREKKMEAHLHQIQKMEAIGTLAGGIAHDFNNILGAMMGYAGLAKFKNTDAKIRPYLEQVLSACERAKDLVNQILTFSRQKEHEKKPILVAPIVKEPLKLIQSSLPAGIDVRLNLIHGNDTVLADATQIHQVLLNLLTNAVHAMQKSDGVLTLGLSHRDIAGDQQELFPDLEAGPYLRIEVGDTGHGIHPSIIDKIFDPFFTTKAPGEGTGLGLSMVYGIVKNHGGAVYVESEPGKGSVFHIYLPLIQEEGEPSGQKPEVIPCGKGHILIVEDEEPLAAIVKEMLASLGYEVTVRFSSLDALEALRANPNRFDLVIADATMPNISGVSLAVQMLRIRSGLPIIVSTGFSETMTEDEAKKLGIRAFIMKPVSFQNLAQTVGRVLDDATRS